MGGVYEVFKEPRDPLSESVVSDKEQIQGRAAR